MSQVALIVRVRHRARVSSLKHYLQGGVVAAVAVVGSVEPARARLALVAFWMKWGWPAA